MELAGLGGATHQQGFSEHSLRKPLARANAQPAFATSPRQPSRVQVPKPKTLMPRHKAGASPSCQQHFVLRTTSSDSLMKKQVSSPFTVVVVELAGLEPATLCLQSRCATSCAIAPLEPGNLLTGTSKLRDHCVSHLRHSNTRRKRR